MLLSHRANLTREGKQSLRLLLQANKRLNTAYIVSVKPAPRSELSWGVRFSDAEESEDEYGNFYNQSYA